MTYLARSDSNDASVATVDALGQVAVKRPGETAVRASFMGQVAVAIVAAPFEILDGGETVKELFA